MRDFAPGLGTVGEHEERPGYLHRQSQYALITALMSKMFMKAKTNIKRTIPGEADLTEISVAV